MLLQQAHAQTDAKVTKPEKQSRVEGWVGAGCGVVGVRCGQMPCGPDAQQGGGGLQFQAKKCQI